MKALKRALIAIPLLCLAALSWSSPAEAQDGQGSTGRVYTVTYRVTDRSGNTTQKSATVLVPTSNSGR
jgi:hypothetical protein